MSWRAVRARHAACGAPARRGRRGSTDAGIRCRRRSRRSCRLSDHPSSSRPSCGAASRPAPSRSRRSCCTSARRPRSCSCRGLEGAGPTWSMGLPAALPPSRRHGTAARPHRRAGCRQLADRTAAACATPAAARGGFARCSPTPDAADALAGRPARDRPAPPTRPADRYAARCAARTVPRPTPRRPVFEPWRPEDGEVILALHREAGWRAEQALGEVLVACLDGALVAPSTCSVTRPPRSWSGARRSRRQARRGRSCSRAARRGRRRRRRRHGRRVITTVPRPRLSPWTTSAPTRISAGG